MEDLYSRNTYLIRAKRFAGTKEDLDAVIEWLNENGHPLLSGSALFRNSFGIPDNQRGIWLDLENSRLRIRWQIEVEPGYHKYYETGIKYGQWIILMPDCSVKEMHNTDFLRKFTQGGLPASVYSGSND